MSDTETITTSRAAAINAEYCVAALAQSPRACAPATPLVHRLGGR